MDLTNTLSYLYLTFISGVTSAAGSLFTYASGMSHSTYLDINFVPIFTISASEAETDAAEHFCGM